MNSLVDELQARALNPESSVSELLRLAKVVAVKLGLDEFRLWVDSELGGYKNTEIPGYRTVHGEMKVRNPFHGLIPVIFPTADIAEMCNVVKLGQKISEIESLAQSSDGRLAIMMPDQMQLLLQKLFNEDMEFKLLISTSNLIGVLDSVRNVILDWSLKLEQNGIKGEGMTFSKDDKAKAHSPNVTYQINSIENFTGNMGSVSGGQVHATSNYDSSNQWIAKMLDQVDAQIEQMDLSSIDSQHVQDISKFLRKEVATNQNPQLIADKLTQLSNILQNATGNLIAQGAIYEISKHFKS